MHGNPHSAYLVYSEDALAKRLYSTAEQCGQRHLRCGLPVFYQIRRSSVLTMLVALLFSCCAGLQCNITALFAQTIAQSQSSTAHQTAHSASATFGKQPEKRAVPPAPSIQFENVTKTSKINFILKNSVSPQRYTFETMAGGVALFDYNNDGLLDIFFTNGGSDPIA